MRLYRTLTRMKQMRPLFKLLLILSVLALAVPALAQTATEAATEARARRLPIGDTVTGNLTDRPAVRDVHAWMPKPDRPISISLNVGRFRRLSDASGWQRRPAGRKRRHQRAQMPGIQNFVPAASLVVSSFWRKATAATRTAARKPGLTPERRRAAHRAHRIHADHQGHTDERRKARRITSSPGRLAM